MDENISKMVNGNLLCKNLTPKKKSVGGFLIEDDQRFKRLEVLDSKEPEVNIGDVVIVKHSVGTEYLGKVIINKLNIIAIE